MPVAYRYVRSTPYDCDEDLPPELAGFRDINARWLPRPCRGRLGKVEGDIAAFQIAQLTDE
jgi:hypothetical protein